MSNWQMSYIKLTGSASSWWNISSPNSDLTITTTSTRTEHDLYTGGKARTIPTTKYNYENVTINWDFISASNSLLTSSAGTLTLKGIVSGGWTIQFKTHELKTGVTETWRGCIQNYPRVYKLGMFKGNSGSETFYDISIDFDLISIT